MAQKDLVAVVCGTVPVPKGLSLVQAGDFQCVFNTRKSSLSVRKSRKSALRAMIQRQRDLEYLMQFGTVLPVLPGTRLKQEDAPVFVAANTAVLTKLLHDLTGCVQFQISIHWPFSDAASHFGWTDSAAVERGTAHLVSSITEVLANAIKDQIELPREPDMLFNAVVLLNGEDDADLDQALEKIDAIWSDGLRIRQVGPSPALSFASLGLRSVAPAAVDAARKALGVASDADRIKLAEAKRQAIMSAPSDIRPKLGEAARLLDAAISAGTDRFPQAYIWREGQAAIQDDSKRVA